MGNRIIISESQYSRVFLNEQTKNGADKILNRKLFFNYDTLKTYQDLYNKLIKNKSDGDNFREWVYKDKKRLDTINNELKKLGYTDGFSKSGAYGNEHFKVAWSRGGELYYRSTKERQKEIKGVGNKKKGENDLNTIDSWDGVKRDAKPPSMYTSKEKEYYGNKVKTTLTKVSMDKLILPKWVANSIDLKEYVSSYNKTKNNWNECRKVFGWKDGSLTMVDQKFVTKFLSVAVGVGDLGLDDFFDMNRTTLLSPEWVVNEVWSLYHNTYKGQNYTPDVIMRDIWVKKFKEEKGYYQAKKLIATPRPGGKRKPWKFNYDVSGVESESEDDKWDAAQDLVSEIENDIVNFKKENGTPVESMMKGYISLLDMIKNWNDRFDTQNPKQAYLCDDAVYDSSRTPVGGLQPLATLQSVLQGPAKYKYSTWKTFCQQGNNMGNWIYNAGSGVDVDGEVRDQDDYGNKDFIMGCGCVNTLNKNMNVFNGSAFGAGFYNPAKRLGQTMHDTRDFYYKADDFIKKCPSDWHCMFDIMSIAVLFLTCPFTGSAGCLASGAMLSIAIDAVSGLGYVYEQDEGWKFNAGLQFFSVFTFGAGKLGKVAKGLVVNGKKYTDIYNKVIKNSMKNYSEVAWKSLSKEQRSKFQKEAFEESFEGLSSSEIKKLISLNNSVMSFAGTKEMKAFIKQRESVSTSNKSAFNKMLKSSEKNVTLRKYIQSEFDKGVDFTTILKNYTKYVPNVKSVLFQGSLFALMFGYPEETAKAVKKGLKFFDELVPSIGLVKMLGVSTDINPDDNESQILKDNLKQFGQYSTLITEIQNNLKDNIYKYLNDYGITPKKNLEDIIINGENSIIGEPLTNVKSRLEDLVQIVQSMKGENKTESEIKDFLETQYNAEIEYLETESVKPNIIKDIINAHNSNPLSKEDEEFYKKNNIDIVNFNFDGLE